MEAKKEKDVMSSNASISNIEGIQFGLPWEGYNAGIHTRVLEYCDSLTNHDDRKKYHLGNDGLQHVPIWMCYFSVLGIISQSCLTCEIKSLEKNDKVKEMGFEIKQERIINTQKSDFVFYTVVFMFVVTVILAVYALYKYWRKPKKSNIYRPAQVTE